MNLLAAFALGAILGAAAVAVCGWHLLRSARAAWHAAEREELTFKTRCEELVDRTTRWPG